jgi:hypothetical protein
MERRRWRAQYDTAKQTTLERDGPPVDNHSATTTRPRPRNDSTPQRQEPNEIPAHPTP